MICGRFLVTFKLEFVVVFRVVTYISVCKYKYGIFHVLKLYHMYIYLFISVCSLQSFLCTPLHVQMFYYCNHHNFHCGYKTIKSFWIVELHSNGLSRFVWSALWDIKEQEGKLMFWFWWIVKQLFHLSHADCHCYVDEQFRLSIFLFSLFFSPWPKYNVDPAV